MIHIDFDPGNLTGDQLTWWTNWADSAEKATQQVVEAWEKWRTNPSDSTYKKIFKTEKLTAVWGELKDWLLENVFHHKCAYCETDMTRSDFHAEHYRPKGRVTWQGRKAKIKDSQGNEVDHPGYFWLAFNWKNLLPSCGWCNTANGKRDQFPIRSDKAYTSVMKGLDEAELNNLTAKIIQSPTWSDIYYVQPVDLDELEGRILLHPYFDEPGKYLRFDDFGNVIPIGNQEERLRGEWSILVYNLKDGRIVKERRKEQNLAEGRYQTAYRHYRDQGLSVDDARNKAKEDVSGYLTGKEPYSAAVVDVLKIAYPDYF